MSLFYDLAGNLLTRGGEALTERHSAGTSTDERTAREFRQIALLMRRLGEIWPSVFQCLYRESAVLEAARDQIFEVIRTSLPSWPPPSAASAPGSDDPLRHYRDILSDLDGVIPLLHQHRSTEWARDALRILREGFASAADIQGELVDRALAV